MITVRFPPHLRRFIDVPDTVEVTGDSIHSIVDELEIRFPGVRGYLMHENGKLRRHVNIFLDEKMVLDRESLTDSLDGVTKLFVMQALSGG